MSIGVLRRWRSDAGRLRLAPRDPDPKLGRSARLLLGGYLLSAVGTGMVYPYLAIYIQQIRGFGGTASAVGLAIIAIGTTAGSLCAGPPTDRFGPRVVGSIALIVQAAAYGLIGLSSGRESIFLACLLIGLGTGAFYAALTPALNQICSPEQHRRAFAARYLINNLGVGVGALLSLAFLIRPEPARFTILYAINAASFLVFLVLYVLALRGRPVASASDGSTEDAATDERFRWRGLLSNRPFVKLLALQVLLVAGGFAQIQSVIPLLLHARLATPPTLISLLLTLNCLGIILLQPLVVRLFPRVPEQRLLVVLGASWVAAFAVGAVASVHGSISPAAIVLFGLIFTVGECFYGPSFHPLVVRMAPKNQVGRYSSIVSALWGAVTFIAPPLGVLLVNSRWPVLLWVGCALCSAAAALVAAGLRPLRTAPAPAP